LPALDFDEDGFEVDTILNARSVSSGLRVTEIPSYEFSRQHGKSNLRTIRDGFRVLRAIGTERVARHDAPAEWGGGLVHGHHLLAECEGPAG
jgi:hypothetical protein